MTRDLQISELHKHKDNSWDVVIIGGGATGLGIALDSATRGYKTLLLEKSDFGSATSSRSTKLVHGGVRYLAKGDLLLVIEALHERGLMLKNAPANTRNQEFVIPLYSLWDFVLYYVGLKFYDILAGNLSLGKSYFIKRSKILSRLPMIRPEGLRGGIVYHDGQFDDARMAICLARTAIKHGATLLNYFPVGSLIKNSSGNTAGVIATDTLTQTEHTIKSGLVINATGVFADSVIRMDNPLVKPAIRPSQGIHIVLDKSFLESDSAIMIPKTDDGRVMFAIPWKDKVVVGTTDTPLEVISEEPEALSHEIDFVLSTAGKYLTRAPSRTDILSVFAGLRPLAYGSGSSLTTKEISRRHKIILSETGLLTITGGKWTTYRRMAEEAIDKAIKAGLLPGKRCITPHLSLEEESPPGSFLSREQIVWIIRNEMPCSIDDILVRRTRALILDARKSLPAAPLVAEIMAVECGHSKKWEEEQIQAYNQLASKYFYE